MYHEQHVTTVYYLCQSVASSPVAPHVLTEHYETCVRVGGAKRILSRAAVHWAVELSRNSLQHELFSNPLLSAIQQEATDTRPREQGLWEDLVLRG